MATPFMLSQDNIELQFATNHVGTFEGTYLQIILYSWASISKILLVIIDLYVDTS